MNLKNLMAKFYLDKEKDIVVKLFKSNEVELTYIIETPNHHTGNLITNLSKVAGVKTVKNENDMKIITGTLYLSAARTTGTLTNPPLENTTSGL